jgi:transcription elongation factor/antiterminator RfaH
VNDDPQNSGTASVVVSKDRPSPAADAAGATDADVRWYVVQTQPHAENKAVFHLERQSFRIFCPRILKTVRHARKVSRVKVPLFPGYLFLSMDAGRTQWRSVNGTFGVSHLITQNDMPQPVPVGVVEAIRMHIGNDDTVDWTRSLRPGQTVRIANGAFADFVGRLEHLDAKGRVRVLLKLMGRDVCVSLHASELTPRP